MIRALYRLIARANWLEVASLKVQRRHTALRIVDVEAELASEKKHLAQLDYAIRETNRNATRAAMRACL